MKKFFKYFIKLFIASIVSVLIFEPMLSFARDSLLTVLKDGGEWLQVYFRVLQNAYNSGYMHGTVVKISEGQWAVDW